MQPDRYPGNINPHLGSGLPNKDSNPNMQTLALHLGLFVKFYTQKLFTVLVPGTGT
jgi:hypothetical protein